MIDDFVEAPEHYEVADARDVYPRLRAFGDEELEVWAAARRAALASAPSITAVRDGATLAAFAITRHLEADSAAFGLPITAVDAIGVRRGSVSDQIARLSDLFAQMQAETANGGLLTALIDLDRPTINEALQQAGAIVAGANLTWSCAAADLDQSLLAAPPKFTEDWYAGNEHELLDAVAAAYGTYRSHYHADSKLSTADSAGPYVSGIAKHVEDGGDVALLRTPSGSIAGFSTLDPHSAFNDAVGRLAVAEIATSGVVPSSRTSGVYEASLLQGLRRLREDGYQQFVFGCTADNFAVQSTWIRIGKWRPRRFCFRLHWWPNG